MVVTHKTLNWGNRSSIMLYNYNRVVIGLSNFLICILLISCTKSENGIKPDDILATLLDVPAISLPLETEQNKLNEGFILVVSNLSEVLSDRHSSYQHWIEPFYSGEISAEKYEDYYQWRRPRYTLRDEMIILTVTPRDTLFFQIDIEGEGPNTTTWFKGWILPEQNRAYVYGKNGQEANWKDIQAGHRLYVSWPNPYPNAVAFDSTSGGGYLELKLDLDLQFEAQWDSYGHGTWWDIYQGSGGW